jgi:O-antigen ligase
MDMTGTIIIFITITCLWLEPVMRFRFIEMRGVSLVNLNFYMLLAVWASLAMKKRRFFEGNNINLNISAVLLVAAFSIFIKMTIPETEATGLVEEILNIKGWAIPYIIFIIFFNILKDHEVCERGISGLLLLLAFTLVPMIVQILGITKLETLVSSRLHDGRAAGFAEANQYAAFLALLAPLTLSYLLYRKDRIVKLLASLLMAMVVFGLFATGSRGGIIAFLTALGVYGFLLHRERMIPLRPIVVGILVLICVASISFLCLPDHSRDLMIARFNPDNFQNAEDFSNGRVDILKNGLRLFMERPFLGYGHGSFVALNANFFNLRLNSHNDYLSFLVHYGILGLSLLLILLWRVFQHVYHELCSDEEPWHKILYASYLAGFAGYLVSMMCVNVMTPAFIFWIFTAFIYRLSVAEPAIVSSIIFESLQGGARACSPAGEQPT